MMLTKLPKEITDKYSIENNTFIRVVKDNPKDKIEVEVGDIKQPDFLPQMKLKRWDNEVNFSIRLKDTEYDKAIVNTSQDKITWDKGNTKIEFYDYLDDEGGYKVVWYLKEKPATNKIEFTIQSKGLDFFYQPELTQKEKDEGCVRPENVVGSYAVYHKTKGVINNINGKEYKCGKFCHIYRPKIIDAEGKETWGILKIENGIYSVEIPQEFLDKAVYPIKSNDTFGYDSQGDTVYGANTDSGRADYITGTLYTSGNAGTLVSFSVYTKYALSGLARLRLVMYSSDGSALRDYTAEIIPGANAAWMSENCNNSFSVVASTSYFLGIWQKSGDETTYYDSGGTGAYNSGLTYSQTGSPPSSITNVSNWDNHLFSIYCTYTPTGGEEYTMPVTVGAFVLTGISNILTKALNLICSVGNFTLTGINNILTSARTIVASVGTFTLTGIEAGLLRLYNMTVSVGSFVFTGITTAFIKALNMVASVGQFTLTGIAAGLTIPSTFFKLLQENGDALLQESGDYLILTRIYDMLASVGNIILTGINIELLRPIRNMIVSVGEFTLTGIDIVFSGFYKILCSAGSFVLTGINIELLRPIRNMTVSVGNFVLTGIDSILTRGINLITNVGEFVLTGIDTNFLRPIINMAVTAGEFALTGIDNILNRGINLVVSAGEFALTGIDILLQKAITMLANVGSFTLTGIDTTLTKLISLIAEAGTFTLTGIETVFTRVLQMAVSVGELTLTGVSIGLTLARTIAVSVGNFVLTGINIELLRPIRNMAVSVGEFLLNGVSVVFKGLGTWKWANISKNISIFTEQSKNTSTFTNQSKTSSDWTNQNITEW